jgi:outer membrane lipoprotein-sorting protein
MNCNHNFFGERTRPRVQWPAPRRTHFLKFSKKKLQIISFFVFWMLLACNKALSADTNAVLDSWFAAQKNLASWSADFTETRSFKTLTQPLTTSGRAMFEMPDKFRWELGRPARTIALGRKDEMFVIYPLLKRAERYPMGQKSPKQWREAMSLLQAGFPHTPAEFNAQFQILSLSQTNGNWRLDLQPRSSSARQMMPELILGVATNDFSLKSTEMAFVDGSRIRDDFANAIINPSLEKDVFEWTPPAGFEVTEPFSK